MTHQLTIETPQGPGLLVTNRAKSAKATLLLNHGAGAGIDTPDLAALAKHLPRHGITVARFEQPWHVAGKRLAGRPNTLDEALVCAADKMRVRTPLVIGGRSAGARAAARTVRGLGGVGCLALSFPLHPDYDTDPAKSRLPDLKAARVPTLVIQGEQDPMGAPAEFPSGIELVAVPGADHSLVVGKRSPFTQSDVLSLVVESTLEWMVREIIG